jgi:hypothetical protein
MFVSLFRGFREGISFKSEDAAEATDPPSHQDKETSDSVGCLM